MGELKQKILPINWGWGKEVKLLVCRVRNLNERTFTKLPVITAFIALITKEVCCVRPCFTTAIVCEFGNVKDVISNMTRNLKEFIIVGF